MKRITISIVALSLFSLIMCGCGTDSTDSKVTVYSNDGKTLSQYTSDGEVHLSSGIYYFYTKENHKEVDVSGTVTVEYQ